MKCFKIIFPILLSISGTIISAQSNYVVHTLKQGETLSTLAKTYNTNVGDIMRLNGMHSDSKLIYGSKIKIPAARVQDSKQQKTAVKQEPGTPPFKPLMHQVRQGETLYSISKQYDVSVEQLKTWNHLADENIKPGSSLIVGNSQDNVYVPSPQKEENQVNDKTNIAASGQTQDNPQPDLNETKSTDVNTQAAQTVVAMSSAAALSKNDEGYFADQFQSTKKKHLHTTSGISKTFKTASGWSDGKYYILANDIDPGTIVKLTADNGSTVYAKVLWNMGDLKENTGLNFRISNAAAAALHIDNSSFNLNVAY